MDFCCSALGARPGACDKQQCPGPRCFLWNRRARSGHHVADLYRAHSSRIAMTPAARLAAAIEVFAAIESERRPAADALKAWGLSHRFAGSGDRAAIAGLVYDALRRKNSAAFLMRADTPRSVILGMLALDRQLDPATIDGLFNGARFAPDPLTSEETEAIAHPRTDAPPHVA